MPPSGNSLRRYRPDIDGLRAVAVIPIVLFHAGIPGVALVGVAMIAGAVFGYDHLTPFPGTAALLPCVGTAALLHAHEQHETGIGKLLLTPAKMKESTIA